MAENWVNVEDDPNIIDAEVDEAIELLENATILSDEMDNALIDDDNEPEELVLMTYQNVTAGDGLDVVEKAKELLRKYVCTYDNWAPEIDQVIRWIYVLLGPMVMPQPHVANYIPCFAKQFT
eukprot:scaffold16936_cov61-Attheya_sp.AAC.2